MRIIPLVASTVNLPGFCEIIGTVPTGLECRTDHGRMLEILKRLGRKELNFQLIIAVQVTDNIIGELKELEQLKVSHLHTNWYAVDTVFKNWRHLVQTETHAKSSLREFFCQVYMSLEMLFPELVMDLIRVPDQSGPLFSLKKRF